MTREHGETMFTNSSSSYKSSAKLLIQLMTHHHQAQCQMEEKPTTALVESLLETILKLQ